MLIEDDSSKIDALLIAPRDRNLITFLDRHFKIQDHFSSFAIKILVNVHLTYSW